MLFLFFLPAAGASACLRDYDHESRRGSTRHQFDGMRKKKAAASGRDRFRDLSEDLLRHVLSFLSPGDALQTCVLDTRWRDHWRRATNLDFQLRVDETSPRFPTSTRFEQLAKLIIHLRGDSPLDKCEIDATLDDETGSTYTNTVPLVEYALKCQAKELLVSAGYIVKDQRRFNVPLISQHLKTIRLKQVNMELSALNFSRCPVLEDLKMQRCSVHARRMSSKSLRRLCITDGCSFPRDFHMRIFAPGLISLQLDGYIGLTPALEYMPSLVTAYVGIGGRCHDLCFCIGRFTIDDCISHAYPAGEGLLLHGLSNTVNLELIATYEISESRIVPFVYKRDLKCCPIFDKLKTLLLNEWFTAIELVCILKHTPILEMLTLQVGDTKEHYRIIRAQETIEQPFRCEHLQTVNIECREIDKGIHAILKILSTCGIPHGKISIKELCSRSDCFSFQKPR